MILVSEIMLQQTQVSRVIVKYKEFVQRFPNLKALSKASNADVLITWKGMGYNSRALRLRDAARTIVAAGRRPAPVFPTSMCDLQAISGIGPYTAAAILNFAFNISTPCIDTNIRRILHRFFVGPENADGTWRKNDRELMKIAGKVLGVALESGFSASAWHACLMDFGSLVMTKTNPKRELLSTKLRSICKAYGKVKVGTKKVIKTEPGIDVDGRFIPRRIIRGKVVEVLRSADGWMSIDEVARMIGFGSMNDQQWFDDVLKGLKRDGLIEIRALKIRLAR